MCRNGIFAMSEIALVTARRARLQRMVEDGDRAAASALELGENPTRFLSTIQIGITSIGIHGVVQGLVTLHDVMEAITGEFKPTSLDDAWAVRRDDGSWLLDGLIPVHEFKDRLSLRELPEEDKGRYHTLSGMLMLELGRVPRTGDAIDWDGWRFEIVDMDNKRIDKVLVTSVPDAAEALQEARSDGWDREAP
jgi:CBS domain containing-hemolysin-like protein